MNRDKLLDAAMRVFAESGFRGATTRRIAEAAGVNEVTLFRHFKSKSALISEAAQLYSRRRRETTLPDIPADPARELGVWCTAQLAHLRESRAMIRKCMAELEEHPDMASCMREGPAGAHHDLRAYAARLRRTYGLADSSDVVNAACTMLMGSMFADAMGRDLMPDMFPQPERRAAPLYARLFLRAIGVPSAATRAGGPAIRQVRRAARA
jgi:AcrR family transcriptional regulator